MKTAKARRLTLWCLGVTVNTGLSVLRSPKTTAELLLEPFSQQFPSASLPRGAAAGEGAGGLSREEALRARHRTTVGHWKRQGGALPAVVFGAELPWHYDVYPEFLSLLHFLILTTDQ